MTARHDPTWAAVAVAAVATAAAGAATVRLGAANLPCALADLPGAGRIPVRAGLPCTVRLGPGVPAWTVAVAAAAALAVLLVAGAVAVVRQWAATRLLLAAALASARPPCPRIAAAARAAGLDPARVTITSHPGVAAFCYGLTRPRVVVAAGYAADLDDDALAAALAHEAAHAAARDPARFAAARTAAALAFFLPVLADLVDHGRVRAEARADASAAARVGLGPLLASLAVAFDRPRDLPAHAAVGPLDADAARVAALTDGAAVPPLRPTPRRAAASAAVAAAVAVASVWAVPAASARTDTDVTVVTVHRTDAAR